MLALMTLSRRLRRWVSGGMMMTVLFTQLAVAAYLCPIPERVAAQEAATVAAEMPDCHGMNAGNDPAQPQLCKAHCSNEAQSAARALMPDLQPNPASMALLVRVLEPLPLVSLIQPPEREPPASRLRDSLPLYLSLHVLRN
jgi:hypothetical protein